MLLELGAAALWAIAALHRAAPPAGAAPEEELEPLLLDVPGARDVIDACVAACVQAPPPPSLPY